MHRILDREGQKHLKLDATKIGTQNLQLLLDNLDLKDSPKMTNLGKRGSKTQLQCKKSWVPVLFPDNKVKRLSS